MRGGNPADLRATDAVERLARGALRATEYADACLRRIAELDPRIGAWRHADAELAMQQARLLDAHRVTGRPIGPLHGVPVAIQDAFDTEDLPTGRGCGLDDGRRPTSDAAAVAKLRAAGALILGKTAITELGCGFPASTRHPADPDRTAGGAGGGSAAAVAAGMAPLALAMQTTSGIIHDASACGVVGFKPSHGLVPRTGSLRCSPPLDTVGGFGRTIEDVALMIDTVAGHDAGDPDTRPSPPPRLLELARSEPPLEPLYAFVPQAGWASADEATIEGFQELGNALGDRWDSVDLPDMFQDGINAHRVLALGDAASSLGHYESRGGERLGTAARGAINEGRSVLASSYQSALEWREVLHTGIERILERYDVIVTPAAAGEIPGDTESYDPAGFTALWTFLGVPAISLPLMQGPGGLPVGVQLVGRRGYDGRLLRTARKLCEFLARME